jgi:hypothetical protein
LSGRDISLNLQPYRYDHGENATLQVRDAYRLSHANVKN